MLEPHLYRLSEQLAKAQLPTWRLAAHHNLALFERAGFPVRIDSIQEIGQLLDTMQENRFSGYMQDLGGLTEHEADLINHTCRKLVELQFTYFPQRTPILPLSTLLSSFALYTKIRGFGRRFKSVLEIGPGCGYLSYFLMANGSLENYSQIEACESFYILQNLVNINCFGQRFKELALPSIRCVPSCFTPYQQLEIPPLVSIKKKYQCYHYPWWRIGDLLSQRFQIVTSNANLLEFDPHALDDYLALISTVLEPDGLFIVQCPGSDAHNTSSGLISKLLNAGLTLLSAINQTVTTMLFVKGKPKNPESLINDVLHDRPQDLKIYSMQDFINKIEGHFNQ